MSQALYQLLRLLFGLVLGAASIGKLLDNRAFAQALAGYELGLPQATLLPLGLAVGLIELLLAVALVAGWLPRTVATMLVALLAAYTGVAGSTLARGLWQPDCGCFGVLGEMPLSMDLVALTGGLLLLSLVYLAAASRHGLPRERNVFRRGD